MVQELVRPGKLPKGAAPDSAWAYLGGKFVPIREAKISVMTHAFNYGTACFEGVRGNWNAEEEQLYLFRIEDHFRRLKASCVRTGAWWSITASLRRPVSVPRCRCPSR